jgi:hypothetical protein
MTFCAVYYFFSTNFMPPHLPHSSPSLPTTSGCIGQWCVAAAISFAGAGVVVVAGAGVATADFGCSFLQATKLAKAITNIKKFFIIRYIEDE